MFAWIMSSIAKSSYDLYEDDDYIDKYEWYYIIFFTLLCALRWNTGADSMGYTVRFIKGFKPDEGNTEIIYNTVTNFIAHNHIPFWIGTGLLAFGQIFPIVSAIKNNRYILITMPFILFGNCYFLTYMNGVRQMVVASMFFYACRYINEKRILPYVTFIIFGSLIHHSAYMLLPLFALAYCNKWIEKINESRFWLLAIYIGCVILGYSPSFQGLVIFAEKYSQIFGYENYTERMGQFLGGEYTAEVHNFGLMMMSYFLVGLFIIWFGPFLKKKYENIIPCFNLWYFFAFAYGCLFFLICNVSHVFIRPVMYLLPFQLIIASLLLWEFMVEPKLKNICVAFIVVIWSECAWNMYKNQDANSFSNYHLVWFYDLSKYKRI